MISTPNSSALIWPIERSAESLTNQYGSFRERREHLVCHTAD